MRIGGVPYAALERSAMLPEYDFSQGVRGCYAKRKQLQEELEARVLDARDWLLWRCTSHLVESLHQTLRKRAEIEVIERLRVLANAPAYDCVPEGWEAEEGEFEGWPESLELADGRTRFFVHVSEEPEHVAVPFSAWVKRRDGEPELVTVERVDNLGTFLTLDTRPGKLVWRTRT